jgi:hypothetical protein
LSSQKSGTKAIQELEKKTGTRNGAASKRADIEAAKISLDILIIYI